MPFEFIPARVEPYTPPTFTSFSIVNPVMLPAGGLVESPAVDSVVELLASSEINREYYIKNTGNTSIHLFFGGEVSDWISVETPMVLHPGGRYYSSLTTAKLSVFGWSNSIAGECILGFFE